MKPRKKATPIGERLIRPHLIKRKELPQVIPSAINPGSQLFGFVVIR
jgi:hypothetical protein